MKGARLQWNDEHRLSYRDGHSISWATPSVYHTVIRCLCSLVNLINESLVHSSIY
jgi:hypothetical protein